jgi:hypothetical protein
LPRIFDVRLVHGKAIQTIDFVGKPVDAGL